MYGGFVYLFEKVQKQPQILQMDLTGLECICGRTFHSIKGISSHQRNCYDFQVSNFFFAGCSPT